MWQFAKKGPGKKKKGFVRQGGKSKRKDCIQAPEGSFQWPKSPLNNGCPYGKAIRATLGQLLAGSALLSDVKHHTVNAPSKTVLPPRPQEGREKSLY